MRDMPNFISEYYNGVIKQVGSHVSLNQEKNDEEIESYKRELENSRKRIVEIIEEKTELETSYTELASTVRNSKER